MQISAPSKTLHQRRRAGAEYLNKHFIKTDPPEGMKGITPDTVMTLLEDEEWTKWSNNDQQNIRFSINIHLYKLNTNVAGFVAKKMKYMS